ncbi:MAG: hypothetical protein KF724_00295 [Phycisphaeraceae bacterium]|nr:hypothetical protein [Phycisphaeraceae bacterium]
MIGFLRRLRHDINYHSARRSADRWSRASDAWLFVSLPVAVIIVLVMSVVIRLDETLNLAAGVVVRNSQGVIDATITGPSQSVPLVGTFVASVEVKQRREDTGWPVTLWQRVHPPEVLISTATGFEAMDPDSADPRARAVRAALNRSMPAVASELVSPVKDEWRFGAVIGTIAVIWLVLIPIGVVGILLARGVAALGAGVMESVRRTRRARGLCPRCGYRTRGLEFKEACPECGELLT